MVNGERQSERSAPESTHGAPESPPEVNKRPSQPRTVNTTARPPTQAAVARELGISPAAITKLKAQGMPTHSADAARQWRAARLHPGRMRADPGPSVATLLQRVRDLADLAMRSAAVGRFDVVAGELRAAMRAVPTEARGQLVLSFDLWRQLIGPHACAVLDLGAQFDAPADDTAAMGSDDADEVGTIVYMLAAGEAEVR
jgi:hypothetical protein